MTRFRFVNEFDVSASPERVRDALLDLEHYPEWWPQVRAVAKIDDDTARVLCRSVLPYTLDLTLHAVRRDPTLLEVEISGDLAGWSRVELEPRGPGATHVVYTQGVVVTHRTLAVASALARPLLRWNHAWMMAGCEAGLQTRAATAAS